MRRFKKLLCALLASVFVIGLCGGLCSCTSTGAPATTEELLVRYVANENVSNYHCKASVGLSVSALGVRAVVPSTADMRTANNSAHGTIDVDLSSLNTRPYHMEFYAELLDNALNCYIGTPAGERTTWKLWKVDMTSKIDIRTVTNLLSSSELTLIAKDSDPEEAYELSVPVAKVLETTFNVTAGPNELAGLNEQGMMDTVGNDKIRVGFTKDCLMRSLNTSILATLKSAATNNVEVRAGIDVAATLDGYGTVDPTEVAIPDAVRNQATPTDTPVDVIEVIGADSPLAGAVGT